MTNFDNFSDFEFSDNADPRAPLALVLDCSSSMVEKREGEARAPLDALDGGLDVLISELNKDPLAKRRVETSVITYGTAISEPTPFATVDRLVIPTLEPMGRTSSGAAIITALEAVEARKKEYKANGIQYYRPFILWITDGLATDDITEAARRVKEAEDRKAVSFFAVGVEGADMESMNRIAPRGALKLAGMNFSELFQWLSASQSSVSASQPGDKVALPAVNGWAEL